MKEVSNKEVVQALVRYFLKQEKEALAENLAHCMLDFHRLATWDHLSEKEKLNFKARMMMNDSSLIDFIKNGPKGALKNHRFNSDDL